MDPTLKPAEGAAQAQSDRDRAAAQLIAARERWHASLAAARQHLAPSNLARRARETAVKDVQTRMKDNPHILIGIGVAILTYFCRKPIFRAIRRLMKEA